ncbi:MAG: hypothetical protein U5J78_01320 [Parasphingorhabdus sp.]|nr:hypothetical protein [Parasphingorhabdus sp.]
MTFAINSIWQNRPRDWHMLALDLLARMDARCGTVQLDLPTGTYGFIDAAAALAFLRNQSARIDGFGFSLPCGLTIQSDTTSDHVGDFSHNDLDALFLLRAQDASNISDIFEGFAANLIMAGAQAVACSRVVAGSTPHVDSMQAFADARSPKKSRAMLPLAMLRDISWLIVWGDRPGDPPSDLLPNLEYNDGLCGWRDSDLAPFASAVRDF